MIVAATEVLGKDAKLFSAAAEATLSWENINVYSNVKRRNILQRLLPTKEEPEAMKSILQNGKSASSRYILCEESLTCWFQRSKQKVSNTFMNDDTSFAKNPRQN